MDISLPTPDGFHAFPFSTPYEIQVSLMKHLYESIEKRQVSIVESPTGTGKTLSLLCSALTWLHDNKDRTRKGIIQTITDINSSEPEWVVQHSIKRKIAELEEEDRNYLGRLDKARRREAAQRKMAKARVTKKPRRSDAEDLSDDLSDEDVKFLPEDDEAAAEADDGLSKAARAILSKIEGNKRSQPAEDDPEPTCTKIYYASRTHSQLSQVLPEMQRLKYDLPLAEITNLHGNSTADKGKRKADEIDEEEAGSQCPPSRTVSLGSRKQLCINDELRSKSSDLDESCRELLGEKGDKRCQFLPPVDEETRMLDFRDQILATPKDIEDLAYAGRQAHICPYFGSRRAIPQAELVTLPYNLLLQKTAREALGIDLTDQIVIIDEAHNLIPTLLSLSTAQLPYRTLSTSLHQVCTYLQKFRNRLSPRNVVLLKRLCVFLDALKKYAAEWKDAALKQRELSKKTEVLTLSSMLERLGSKAASINLLEIEQYLKKSKVARKIAGYSEKLAENEASKTKGVSHPMRKGMVPPLHSVENFMIAISGKNEDGRVTFSLFGKPDEEEVEIKYQHLNPAPHFLEVVESARSVILAGGTMSPISDVVNQLFPTLSPDRLSTFSCGHIIPEKNLKALVVSKSPKGAELEYKAGKQNEPAVLADLGQTLLNLANLVPAGMVVFFPSYNFLNLAKAFWTKEKFLDKFSSKKSVFFEPVSSSDVENVLQEYGEAAKAPNPMRKGGALLFAVVGAKLSEGLNFADDLARAVVIIGLPFANLGSVELRERMKYVKELQTKSGTKPEGQKDAAAELYENMCMNAVNQSIGRAIRHKGDWASLILLDRRYAGFSVRNKLPNWIGGGLIVTEAFGQTMKELGRFFRQRNEPVSN